MRPNVEWTLFTSTWIILWNSPIPEDESSLSVPRICIGKYVLNDNKYVMPFNITVSHVFVDGYHIYKVLKEIEDRLDNIYDIFK